MRLLDVWLHDRLVGTISETRRNARGTVPFASRMLHDVAVE